MEKEGGGQMEKEEEKFSICGAEVISPFEAAAQKLEVRGPGFNRAF